MKVSDRAMVKAHHTCACVGCDSSIASAVTSGRQSSNHIAVRFWSDDVQPEWQGLRGFSNSVVILLDGERVERAFEAILGEDGSIWRYRQEPLGFVHTCVTCEERGTININPCVEHLTGRVEMRVDRSRANLFGHTPLEWSHGDPWYSQSHRAGTTEFSIRLCVECGNFYGFGDLGYGRPIPEVCPARLRSPMARHQQQRESEAIPASTSQDSLATDASEATARG